MESYLYFKPGLKGLSHEMEGGTLCWKGPVNYEHLKDSALYQVSYSKYYGTGYLYSKFWCSKVTTLVWCQTYNLEIEAYFSTGKVPTALFAKQNISNLRDSIICGFFLNHHNLESLCLAKKYGKYCNKTSNSKLLSPEKHRYHVVSNEMFWYSAQTLKCNWLTDPLTKYLFFASEAPGFNFKETFRLMPLLYPLPYRQTVPFRSQYDAWIRGSAQSPCRSQTLYILDNLIRIDWLRCPCLLV